MAEQYCKTCGKLVKDRLIIGMCQACYNYFRLGGKVYPLPPKGTVGKTVDGKIICHICGRAYRVLGGHIRESHHMTIKAYKEEFGICNKTHLTEKTYSEKMKNYAYRYNMDEQLRQAGVNTRISKTNHLRLGKKSRLEECLAKRNRKKKT